MKNRLSDIEEIAKKSLMPLARARQEGLYRCIGCMCCTRYRKRGEKLLLEKCEKTDKQAWVFLAHDQTDHEQSLPLYIIMGESTWKTDTSELCEEEQLINLQDKTGDLNGSYMIQEVSLRRYNGVDQFFIKIRKFGGILPELPIHIVFPHVCEYVLVQ